MAGHAVSGTPALAGSAIKRAAALRQKYRMQEGKQRLIPRLVAQHPANRGGIGINGQRADELLRSVLGHFDEGEASYGAVCVEEQPNSTSIMGLQQSEM